MKTLTAKNIELSIDENIHNAIKSLFGFAESFENGIFYRTSSNSIVQVLWPELGNENNIETTLYCEAKIHTNEGICYIVKIS